MCAKSQASFDFSKARGPRPGPDVGSASPGQRKTGPISVSVLVGRIKGALAEAFGKCISVVGEISNFKRHGSGHLYFRLKDAEAAIDAVMFKSHAGKLKFAPADGLEVVAEGRVDVYETQGRLQIYVERLLPKGAGELELAFRQLHEKLAREGLFDPAAKKPIGRFPRGIGLVTSAGGAAIRDISRTLAQRWPAARVYLFPTAVQGAGAAEQIAQAVAMLDAHAKAYQIDTIIVARGGGSLEDLWSFNEEEVARAIFAAGTPIISGVGHEVDVTIADMASDVRAATPTAAAVLAVPDADEIRRHVMSLGTRLGRTVVADLGSARATLAGILRSAVFRDPRGRLRTHMQRMDELAQRLRVMLAGAVARARKRMEQPTAALAAVHPARLSERARASLSSVARALAWALGSRSKGASEELLVLRGRLVAAGPTRRLQLARQHITAVERQLAAMSYRNVLNRGYSVTRTAGGAVARRSSDVKPGELIQTELSEGKIDSVVRGDKTNVPPKARTKQEPQRREPGLFG